MPRGVVVSMVAFHANGQGSNPARTLSFFRFNWIFFLNFTILFFSFIIEKYEPILCQHVGYYLKHPKKCIRFWNMHIWIFANIFCIFMFFGHCDLDLRPKVTNFNRVRGTVVTNYLAKTALKSYKRTDRQTHTHPHRQTNWSENITPPRFHGGVKK